MINLQMMLLLCCTFYSYNETLRSQSILKQRCKARDDQRIETSNPKVQKYAASHSNASAILSHKALLLYRLIHRPASPLKLWHALAPHPVSVLDSGRDRSGIPGSGSQRHFKGFVPASGSARHASSCKLQGQTSVASTYI